MSETSNLYEERIERMEITIRGGKPDRVPVMSIIDNWAFEYAGYTLQEIFQDDEKHYKAFEKITKDFKWDSLQYAATTRAMNFYNALDGGTYRDSGTLQVESGTALCMKPEEYPQLIENPWTFLRDVIYPRKYKLMAKEYSDEKYDKYIKAVKLLFDFNKMAKENVKRLKDNYGMPVVRPSGFFHPIDMLLDFLRDFSGTMGDIKRRPSQVREAADAMLPICIETIENFYPEHQKGCYIFNPMHTPEFLNAKDFEKVYWPSYKKIMDYLANKGYVIMCYYENKYEHLFEFLQELPKNSVVGLFEHDDLTKVKKVLGDTMCIAGGIPAYMLNYGTKQECIDYSKKIIDNVAPGGGFIFCTDKILHSPNDANPENLRAVNEFVFEYGKY
ncbi:MAG: uroporphyrinogen decarboxylase family protein [Eubacteriales bacterium]